MNLAWRALASGAACWRKCSEVYRALPIRSGCCFMQRSWSSSRSSIPFASMRRSISARNCDVSVLFASLLLSFASLVNRPIDWNIRRGGPRSVLMGLSVGLGYLLSSSACQRCTADSGRRLLSPRRARLCSRRTPSLRGRRTDALDMHSEPLRCRRRDGVAVLCWCPQSLILSVGRAPGCR
jgi:hypothetical protein